MGYNYLAICVGAAVVAATAIVDIGIIHHEKAKDKTYDNEVPVVLTSMLVCILFILTISGIYGIGG